MGRGRCEEHGRIAAREAPPALPGVVCERQRARAGASRVRRSVCDMSVEYHSR
jgi:hypothetical protein